ncbi:hypothetical protein EDC39_101310 [Geothermobacter ehrlichii]|uniref:Uncharacterized protein n=1 Tax=Geothermobacter ehrlichii TaxID=213224 RepID=A0A5D3WQS4_9BACT|nr:hypothetical protein [Geothermobacter ehrlichii]TYP00150.1 hypothetical protein EDC39_101310 [Geothermobacter ehrlichii]
MKEGKYFVVKTLSGHGDSLGLAGYNTFDEAKKEVEKCKHWLGSVRIYKKIPGGFELVKYYQNGVLHNLDGTTSQPKA